MDGLAGDHVTLSLRQSQRDITSSPRARFGIFAAKEKQMAQVAVPPQLPRAKPEWNDSSPAKPAKARQHDALHGRQENEN